MPPSKSLCSLHENRLCRYCIDHGLIMCWTCGEAHRRCRKTSLSKACMKFNVSLEEDLLRNDTIRMLTYARDVHSQLERHIRLNVDLDVGIERIRRSMNNILSKMKTQATTLQTSLSEYQSTVINTVTTLEEASSDAESEQTYDGLLQLYKRGRAVNGCDKALERVVCSYGQQSSEVTREIFNLARKVQRLHDSNVKGLLKNTFHVTSETFRPHPKVHYPFGLKYLSTDNNAAMDEIDEPLFPLKLTPFYHFVVRVDTDVHDCFITGLDAMSDGCLILADYDNSTIKLLSPDGVILSHLTLQEEPTDIAIINQSEIAVSVDKNQIIIVEVDRNHQLSLKRALNLKKWQWADRLVSYRDRLVFTYNMYSEECDAIQMIDLNGIVKWNVYTDKRKAGTERCKLFNDIDFLTTATGREVDFVIATDQSQYSVFLISADTGQVQNVVQLPNKPLCIVGGGHTYLYVCYMSGEVTEWDIESALETCIVPAWDNVEDPYAMTYDQYRERIILTSQSRINSASDLVHIYSISLNGD